MSFCFDDFPRTAYTVGGAILKNFGARGTYYAAMGMMNTNNDLGDQFTREDLDCLLADGHELASHTFSHISCRNCVISCVRRRRAEGKVRNSRDYGLRPRQFFLPIRTCDRSCQEKDRWSR